ncbi:hypothetical protein KSP40_PGU002519 [Platanthera guangdongensis]|uniref:Uncharacterized protein n=1 Tax=Platanthera guangdongensis TaxID=2320717 RepID=A0ABR2LF11_9ASPA
MGVKWGWTKVNPTNPMVGTTPRRNVHTAHGQTAPAAGPSHDPLEARSQGRAAGRPLRATHARGHEAQQTVDHHRATLARGCEAERPTTRPAATARPTRVAARPTTQPAASARPLVARPHVPNALSQVQATDRSSLCSLLVEWQNRRAPCRSRGRAWPVAWSAGLRRPDPVVGRPLHRRWPTPSPPQAGPFTAAGRPLRRCRPVLFQSVPCLPPNHPPFDRPVTT